MYCNARLNAALAFSSATRQLNAKTLANAPLELESYESDVHVAANMILTALDETLASHIHMQRLLVTAPVYRYS